MKVSRLLIAFGTAFCWMPILAIPQEGEVNVDPTGKTIGQYLEAVREKIDGLDLKSEESAKEISEVIESQSTGAPSFSGEQNATIKNFLPRLGAFAQLVEPDEEGKKLAVLFNPFDLAGGVLQAQAVFHEPEVHAPFAMQLNESEVAEVVESIQKTIKDGDDVSIELSWNLENGIFGRNAEGKGEISKLFSEVVQKSKEDLDESIPKTTLADLNYKLSNSEEMREKLRSLREQAAELGHTTGDINFDDVSLDGLSEPLRNTIVTMVVQALQRQALLTKNIREKMEFSKFNKLATLINNNDQLHFTGAYRARDSFAGPNEWSFQCSYELGIKSFKGYINSLDKDEEPSLNNLKDYLEEKNWFNSEARFAFTASYAEIDALNLALRSMEGMPPVTFTQEKDKRLELSVGFGGYTNWDKQENPVGRLDFSLSYEDWDSDVNRQDRGIATLSYTYEVGSNISIPLTLTYANHSRYLGEVDTELNAHVGLSYKIDRK